MTSITNVAVEPKDEAGMIKFLDSVQITDNDPVLAIKWEAPAVEAFALAANNPNFMAAPPFLVTRPFTARSVTTQVVNHLKSAVNGRSFEDIIIGPLDQDEFATVITMIRDIEMSAFFQAAGAANQPLARLGYANNRSHVFQPLHRAPVPHGMVRLFA